MQIRECLSVSLETVTKGDGAMLNRWDPFTEIARLHDEMVRNLGARDAGEAYKASFTPAVDILDDKDAVLVKAELPGVKPEDVHVSVENDVLTLKGERKFEHKDRKEGLMRVERAWGTFTRSFSLPKTVDGERVEADMADGVLTLRIPKRQAPQPKRVEVRTGTPQGARGGTPS